MMMQTRNFETVELRRYTMNPGCRDRLIDLFEREFIESQEACGMVPIGQYRDLDDPDVFVWFRGFETFESRADCLEAFYGRSRAWIANRDAANATIVDSDDVLMLRSARPGSGFDLSGLDRDATEHPAGSFVAVSTAALLDQDGDVFTTSFERESLEKLNRCGKRIAYFLSETRPNAFPRLPVRENDRVFVVTGVCADRAALEHWSAALPPGVFITMQLQPAPRSLYR